MPQGEEPRPPSATIEPALAAASAPSFPAAEETFAELAAARGRLREASARIAATAEALEQDGEESERAMALVAGAVADGSGRLDSGQRHGEEALQRWTEALEEASVALGRSEKEREDARAAFESEVAQARRDLDERLSELAGSLGALGDAVADLGSGAEALAGGLDESVSGVEQAAAVVDKAAGALRQEIESESGHVIDILGRELGPILAEGLEGLAAVFDTHLAATENPFAIVEREATALLMAGMQTLSNLGSEATGEAPRVLEEVAPAWDTPRALVCAALDETVDGHGAHLLEELEHLRGTLRTGVAIAAAWTAILPQLPALPDTAERVREFDLLDPN
jgi:hypothetical protein